MKWIFITALFLISSACTATDPSANKTIPQNRDDMPNLRAAMKKVEPFFERMHQSEQYDWLGSHREPGQTFDEYLESNPIKLTQERQKIYVLPLGKFTAAQKNILSVTADYLEAFYDLPVVLMDSKSLVHPTAKDDSRRNAVTHVEQIRTDYILDNILKPILPPDAAALIAFTDVDLFPDSSMYFVFGQASMDAHVGVWSLKRLGDKNPNTFLLRVLKIAAHETGHMFSFKHCTKYECVMSGTNQLSETDRRPLDACPECMAKVCFLSDTTPRARYERLEAFCRKNGLIKEADKFKRKADAVR